MKVILRQRRTKLYIIRNREKDKDNQKSIERKKMFPEFESADEKDTLCLRGKK